MTQAAFNDQVGLYLEYLTRQTRTGNIRQWEAHQLLMSRIVAREYGVTDDQLKWLDENL